VIVARLDARPAGLHELGWALGALAAKLLQNAASIAASGPLA
jgi:hypothetical protein